MLWDSPDWWLQYISIKYSKETDHTIVTESVAFAATFWAHYATMASYWGMTTTQMHLIMLPISLYAAIRLKEQHMEGRGSCWDDHRRRWCSVSMEVFNTVPVNRLKHMSISQLKCEVPGMTTHPAFPHPSGSGLNSQLKWLIRRKEPHTGASPWSPMVRCVDTRGQHCLAAV